MAGIDKEINRVKFVTFGKVKVKLQPKADKVLMELQKQKIDCFKDNVDDESKDNKIEDIDKKIAQHLITEQENKVCKRIIVNEGAWK